MFPPASRVEAPSQTRRRDAQGATYAIDSLVSLLDCYRIPLLACATIAYFAITAYRAHRRLFWFDEIFTLYISHLPSIGSIWRTCAQGVDSNPPALYLVTRWSQDLFGATEFGARAPQIIGFWLFCLSLYRFVALRTNALGGFIALLLPLTTEGYWYAYEARSHGLVLAFFGLALISWQAAAHRLPRQWAPVAALAASLTCAALCHGYSFLIFIPLGIGELIRTILRRRLDTAVWAALLLPLLLAAAVVLSLLVPARGVIHDMSGLSAGESIWRVVDLSFNPRLAVAFLLIASIVVLWRSRFRLRADNIGSSGDSISQFAPYEIAVLAGILCTPLFAFLAGRLANTPVFARYSLIVVGAIAGLVGGAFSRHKGAGLVVLGLTVLCIARQSAHFYEGDDVTQPGTGLEIGTRRAALDEQLRWIGSQAQGSDPIVLSDYFAFAPIFHYAPVELRSRLTFLIPKGRLALLGESYLWLQRCCGAPGIVSTERDFLAAHHVFFIYGTPDSLASENYTLFRRLAGQMRAGTCSSGNCLFRVVLDGEGAEAAASQSEKSTDSGK
jgi:hypothetical protein